MVVFGGYSEVKRLEIKAGGQELSSKKSSPETCHRLNVSPGCSSGVIPSLECGLWEVESREQVEINSGISDNVFSEPLQRDGSGAGMSPVVNEEVIPGGSSEDD